MLQKTFLFVLLQVLIFLKQGNSKDASPKNIPGLTAKVNKRGLEFCKSTI